MDRSEVAIKCEEKAFEMLKKVYEDKNCLPDKVYKDEDCFIIHWNWIKWCDYIYEDIAAIAGVLDELDKLQKPDNHEDTGYGYKFMRLGESDDDVETRKNDYDIELWMIRKIDIPEGLEEVK